MATEVKAWRADDSTLHDTRIDAARRDVESVLTTAFGSDWNAKIDLPSVLIFLLDRREDVIRVLQEYHRACPPPKTASPAVTGPGVRQDPPLGAACDEIVADADDREDIIADAADRMRDEP